MGPAVKLSATALNFGSEALGESNDARMVVLTNTGTAALTIKDVAISGNFTIFANACAGAELIPSKNCKLYINFAPTMLGKQTGTLAFSDDSTNSPQTIQLSGVGVEPATLLPGAAYYGNRAVGTTSAPKTLTLTNNQNGTLSNISVSATGDFAVSSTTCAPSLTFYKGKCTISVTFTPTTSGKRTGQLIVSDNASNNPQISNLQGTGK